MTRRYLSQLELLYFPIPLVFVTLKIMRPRLILLSKCDFKERKCAQTKILISCLQFLTLIYTILSSENAAYHDFKRFPLTCFRGLFAQFV